MKKKELMPYLFLAAGCIFYSGIFSIPIADGIFLQCSELRCNKNRR